MGTALNRVPSGDVHFILDLNHQLVPIPPVTPIHVTASRSSSTYGYVCPPLPPCSGQHLLLRSDTLLYLWSGTSTPPNTSLGSGTEVPGLAVCVFFSLVWLLAAYQENTTRVVWRPDFLQVYACLQRSQRF